MKKWSELLGHWMAEDSILVILNYDLRLLFVSSWRVSKFLSLIVNVKQETICERMAYNMTIQTISKEDKNVTVELSADDLVMICNALYLHSKEQDLQSKEQKTNDHFLQLYSDMMIARDLCQYGHVDNFCLRNVVACRNDIGKGIGVVLSEED